MGNRTEKGKNGLNFVRRWDQSTSLFLYYNEKAGIQEMCNCIRYRCVQLPLSREHKCGSLRVNYTIIYLDN